MGEKLPINLAYNGDAHDLLSLITVVINNSPEFHENPSGRVVCDTESHTDEQADSRGLHIQRNFFNSTRINN
jgi:hypothetical protein